MALVFTVLTSSFSEIVGVLLALQQERIGRSDMFTSAEMSRNSLKLIRSVGLQHYRSRVHSFCAQAAAFSPEPVRDPSKVRNAAIIAHVDVSELKHIYAV